MATETWGTLPQKPVYGLAGPADLTGFHHSGSRYRKPRLPRRCPPLCRGASRPPVPPAPSSPPGHRPGPGLVLLPNWTPAELPNPVVVTTYSCLLGPEAAWAQGLPTPFLSMTFMSRPHTLSNKAQSLFLEQPQGKQRREGRKRTITMSPSSSSPHLYHHCSYPNPPSSSKPTSPTHTNTSKQTPGEQGIPSDRVATWQLCPSQAT